jgi:prepilin-type N-terminal cleavage/methylation domain-containing protein
MKREKGFTLVEVIIALAILGVIGIAFLGALATASKAVIVADERATAESLSRSEMEYVKSQDYSSAEWSYELPSGTSPTGQFPDWWDFDDPHTLPDGYTGFIVTVNASTLASHTIDDGIQKITVTIEYFDEGVIISLEGYKTAR